MNILSARNVLYSAFENYIEGCAGNLSSLHLNKTKVLYSEEKKKGELMNTLNTQLSLNLVSDVTVKLGSNESINQKGASKNK